MWLGLTVVVVLLGVLGLEVATVEHGVHMVLLRARARLVRHMPTDVDMALRRRVIGEFDRYLERVREARDPAGLTGPLIDRMVVIWEDDRLTAEEVAGLELFLRSARAAEGEPDPPAPTAAPAIPTAATASGTSPGGKAP